MDKQHYSMSISFVNPLTSNDASLLVSDVGCRIARIDYDCLNNPVRIQFTDGNVTRYVYSATGEKLRVIYQTAVPNITVAIGSVRELAPSEVLYTDSTDYLLGGALTLRNGRIDKYQFEEGYCQAESQNATQDNFTFLYYDKDHLGNVRQVTKAMGSNGTVVQTMNYYPFGMQFCDGSAASGDVQPYKYNGKELDKMHGLNTYDYGARQYYSVLPIWDRPDPLAEEAPWTSPYVYCKDNPVNVVDLDGKWGWDVNGNLISDGRDNEYTLSTFLNTSLYNASLILSSYRILHNDKNVYLNSGVMLNKDNLYIIQYDNTAPVVHNTKEAIFHYYHGNGEPADVGDKSTTELLSSKKFQSKLNKITTQKVESEGYFSVDMTKNTFHIGHTNVDYKITNNGTSCSVIFTLFARDGFWDPDFIGENTLGKIGIPFFKPDGMGPNLECGGNPYPYKTRICTFFFKPIE